MDSEKELFPENGIFNSGCFPEPGEDSGNGHYDASPGGPFSVDDIRHELREIRRQLDELAHPAWFKVFVFVSAPVVQVLEAISRRVSKAVDPPIILGKGMFSSSEHLDAFTEALGRYEVPDAVAEEPKPREMIDFRDLLKRETAYTWQVCADKEAVVRFLEALDRFQKSGTHPDDAAATCSASFDHGVLMAMAARDQVAVVERINELLPPQLTEEYVERVIDVLYHRFADVDLER
ncbi:MAG: hypothetical protein JRD89_15595 [Deltaproteobacteria bacterium]|nr:hypothetical protein [Deltaproteobacteria bacterium]